MHGKFIPMVLTGAAQQLKGRLYRFEAARKNAAPDWSGGDRQMDGDMPATPLTDVAFWGGRYVYAPLHLRPVDSTTVIDLNDAVVRVEREADIVTTRMAGRDGTVKENVGQGDWKVELVIGLQAIDEDSHNIIDEYPAEQVRQLRTILTAGTAIDVASEFLRLFGITRIVVTRVAAEQSTASNYQVFNVDARSDEEINLLAVDS